MQTIPASERVPASALRALVVLLAAGVPLTMRELACRLGRSLKQAEFAAHRLIAHGLARYNGAGTLRPACRFIPAHELEKRS
jgi:predicted transcriptional regulator